MDQVPSLRGRAEDSLESLLAFQIETPNSLTVCFGELLKDTISGTYLSQRLAQFIVSSRCHSDFSIRLSRYALWMIFRL